MKASRAPLLLTAGVALSPAAPYVEVFGRADLPAALACRGGAIRALNRLKSSGYGSWIPVTPLAGRTISD